jgi:leucine efflux protein
MFGVQDYPAFCLAILVFLALPGPGTLALLSATGQGGLRAGAAATLGLIVGDQALLWLAVAGVAALLAAHPGVFNLIQYAGAAYLVWLGLKLLFGRADAAADGVRLRPGHFTRQAFFITLLNPKAIVFYMAFFPIFIDASTHRGLPTFAFMAATIAVISAVYCLTLCALAKHAAARVRAHGGAVRWLERAAGVFLLGFGWRLVRE